MGQKKIILYGVVQYLCVEIKNDHIYLPCLIQMPQAGIETPTCCSSTINPSSMFLEPCYREDNKCLCYFEFDSLSPVGCGDPWLYRRGPGSAQMPLV